MCRRSSPRYRGDETEDRIGEGALAVKYVVGSAYGVSAGIDRAGACCSCRSSATKGEHIARGVDLAVDAGKR